MLSVCRCHYCHALLRFRMRKETEVVTVNTSYWFTTCRVDVIPIHIRLCYICYVDAVNTRPSWSTCS